MSALPRPVSSTDTTPPVRPGSPELAALFTAIAEGASQRDAERVHPFEAVGLLRQARFGALRLPVAAGGAGASLRQLIDAVLGLAAADPNVAHIVRNHFAFVDRFVLPLASTQPGHPWVRAVADGAIFGLASGELSTGAVGNGALDTLLTPDGQGGWTVEGVKFYSTGSLYADYVLVRARTAEGANASVVVPVGREGLVLEDDWDGIGQRVTGSGTTRLQKVRVAADEVEFDSAGTAYGLPYSSTLAQLFVTSVAAGILRGIEQEAVALVKRRGERSFNHAAADKPADDPLLQQTIGQISAAAFAAQTVALAAADALDAAADARLRGAFDRELAHQGSIATAKAKVVIDELVVRAGSQLFDVGGASAATRRYNLDRHWRNARTLVSHNPTAYKARALGEYAVHGTPLPASGFF